MRTTCWAWSVSGSATCPPRQDRTRRRFGHAPAMAEAHDRLGFVLGQQGKIAEALAQFERAVQLRPGPVRRAIPSRRDALVCAGFRAGPAGPAGGRETPSGSPGSPLLSGADAPASQAARRGHRAVVRSLTPESRPCRRADAARRRAPGGRRSRQGHRPPRSRGADRSVADRLRATASGWRCRRRAAATKPWRCSTRVAKAEPAFFCRAAESRGRADAAGQSRARGVGVPRARRQRIRPTRRPSTTSGSRSSRTTTSPAPKRSCGTPCASIRSCRRRRSRWASCSGRRDGATRPSACSAKRIARKPDYAEAHYMLGVLLKQLGKLDEAIAQFRTAVDVSAGDGRSAPQPGARRSSRKAMRPAPARRTKRPNGSIAGRPTRRPPPSR